MRIILFLFSIIFVSCNNKGKDSVEKADSANKAILDSGLKTNQVVIDENSSEFLVRANSFLRIYKDTISSERNTLKPATQTLIRLIINHNKTLNDSIIALAERKSVVLPSNFRAEVSEMSFTDEQSISMLIKWQKEIIGLFENAVLDAKDPEVRSFADKALPVLRADLESAKMKDKKI